MNFQKEHYDIVTSHLDTHTENYLKLLESAREALLIARKMCSSDIVFGIYSRKTKQIYSELKSKSKILNKFSEEHSKNTDYNIFSMADIVALTTVVYYPDQINVFLEKLATVLSNNRLEFDPYVSSDGKQRWTKVHREKGYHATHIKLKSQLPPLRPLRIEVQIKTMLHDAWGAKMHDLVYKPAGELDPKLRSLMESFGDSLQAIEVQSETLRDAIEGRVRLLRQRRRAALIQLMDKLENESFETEVQQQKFRDCFDFIDNQRQELANCNSDEELMLEAIEKITRLQNHSIPQFVQLKLSVFLASLRDDTDLAPIVDEAITDWTNEERPNPDHLTFVSAAAFHQTNRTPEAIRRIRSHLKNAEASSEIGDLLRLNLANYIVENNLYKVNKSDRSEAEQLLVEIRERVLKTSAKGAYLSTLAAIKIVFGNEAELDVGLQECSDAQKIVDASGSGYCELYLTHGWQRKLRV